MGNDLADERFDSDTERANPPNPPQSGPDQLREQIEAIKRRATTKFHNDHADGDLTIYSNYETVSLGINGRILELKKELGERDELYGVKEEIW